MHSPASQHHAQGWSPIASSPHRSSNGVRHRPGGVDQRRSNASSGVNLVPYLVQRRCYSRAWAGVSQYRMARSAARREKTATVNSGRLCVFKASVDSQSREQKHRYRLNNLSQTWRATRSPMEKCQSQTSRLMPWSWERDRQEDRLRPSSDHTVRPISAPSKMERDEWNRQLI